MEEKKKGRWKIVTAAAVAAVVIIAIVICWTMGIVGGISESEARAAAEGTVPGGEKIDHVTVREDSDDGRMMYEVQILTDSSIRDVEVGKRGGKILSEEVKSLKPSSGKVIGIDEAIDTALREVRGADEENSVVWADADTENGNVIYEISINYDRMEYEFDIDGKTGRILSKESEPADN